MCLVLKIKFLLFCYGGLAISVCGNQFFDFFFFMRLISTAVFQRAEGAVSSLLAPPKGWLRRLVVEREAVARLRCLVEREYWSSVLFVLLQTVNITSEFWYGRLSKGSS